MRELAAIVLVCSKAIEGVVDVLSGRQSSRYPYRDDMEFDTYA